MHKKLLILPLLLVSIVLISSCSKQTELPSTDFEIEEIWSSEIAGTGSMLPTINQDTKLLLRDVNSFDEIKTNDIILFKNSKNTSKYIVHRCIYKLENSCITKGDNNPTVDEIIITEEHLVSKVVGLLYETGTIYDDKT